MPATQTHVLPDDEETEKMRPTAAFFDVDNTMMRGASLFPLARKMYRHKAFSLRQILWFLLHQLRFAARGEHLGDIRAIQGSRTHFGGGFSRRRNALPCG